MDKEKAEKILKKIGLTNQESRVYLTLLELQEIQTGALCTRTKIASSNIYKILESLIKKGLVNYRIQNNIKIFMPSSPETLNEIFSEKQKEIEEESIEIRELISSLKKQNPSKEAYSNYKYYEGIIGIKSMWHEINEKMNSGNIVKIYTAKAENYERLIGFYNLHHDLRKQKKVIEQMILPTGETELAKRRKNKFTEIKFMDLDNGSEWGVFGDFFFIQHISDKVPRSFLIKDKVFAKTHEQVFDQLWKNAKK
jgi:sugar-specific transcriptional regulator TrmB